MANRKRERCRGWSENEKNTANIIGACACVAVIGTADCKNNFVNCAG